MFLMDVQDEVLACKYSSHLYTKSSIVEIGLALGASLYHSYSIKCSFFG